MPNIATVSKTNLHTPRCFPTGHSKAVPLLQFFFICASVVSGPRVTLAGRKSALNPTVVYSTDRSKAVVPVLVLLFVASGLFYEAICLCLTLCHFVLVFFSIAITSLGEERANLNAFRTFCSICACLDLSVSSSSWGLGWAAVCDCGTPWNFLLLFFIYDVSFLLICSSSLLLLVPRKDCFVIVAIPGYLH